jgi:tRNA modification GTPase
MQNDTIIAISTPIGFGGLGIIRLSGPQSLEIAKKIFVPKDSLEVFPPRQALLGHLHDSGKNLDIDEVLLLYFPAPNSYTTEDMIEISCHGSPVILEEAVRLGIHSGARLAEAGEFTQRAFLNGRIDILQAEAVGEMIQARSLGQARTAFSQMEGRLSRRMSTLRKAIVHILSQLEASLEFPDEGLHLSPKIIMKTLDGALAKIQSLIRSYDLGKSMREGISLAVAGKTNVGKSTLFNKLLERERALVTPYPGTTRDYLAESIRISDSFFTLIDTAGIAPATHPVEMAGIKKGKQVSSDADGILLVLDISRPLEPEDRALIRKHSGKRPRAHVRANTLIILNKCDLKAQISREEISRLAEGVPILEISALKGTNLSTLKDSIANLFALESGGDGEIILQLRQKLLLEDMRAGLAEAKSLLGRGCSEELAAEEIRRALPLFAQLTGEIRTEEVLRDIFGRFCVGK